MERCKYQDCGRSERYRGYCQKHYYELLYSGELPRVRRKKFRPPEQRFAGKYLVHPVTDCWIWLGGVNRGYAVIAVDFVTFRRASHVSYEACHGTIPDGMLVLHKCDNPKCINPNHLFLGSAFDNMLDCKAKGRLAAQKGTYRRKITDRMADSMRIDYARGRHSIECLAEIYGVSHQHVTSVLRGRGHQLRPFNG